MAFSLSMSPPWAVSPYSQDAQLPRGSPWDVGRPPLCRRARGRLGPRQAAGQQAPLGLHRLPSRGRRSHVCGMSVAHTLGGLAALSLCDLLPPAWDFRSLEPGRRGSQGPVTCLMES